MKDSRIELGTRVVAHWTEGVNVTVCIAARCGNTIVCTSDRMISYGDVQYEPHRQKIASITNSIVVMTAGDASFTTLVVPYVMRAVEADIANKPMEWIRVRDVVDYYVKYFLEFKLKFAEKALLAPLGLTWNTFIDRQKTMDASLVKQLTGGMLDYVVPDCAVIIAGIDPDGQHIYTVEGAYVSAHDTIGFASVGSGSRHAQSHFIQSRHSWQTPLSEGLLTSYVAKRRSEVAPGVGKETDIVLLGPNLGNNVLVSDDVKARLDIEYLKIVAAEAAVADEARLEIAKYVDSLTPAPDALPSEQAPEETEGTTP